MSSLRHLVHNKSVRILLQNQRVVVSQYGASTPGAIVTMTSNSHVTSPPPTAKADVERVRQVFQEYGNEQNNNNSNDSSVAMDPWERLWRDGITPWDLGGPTAVLLSELRKQVANATSVNNSSSWKTALIPGCGSGYDVVSLARYWDQQEQQTEEASTEDYHRTVYGLDLSETSIRRAKEVLQDSIQREGPLQCTTIHLYQGNFFDGPLGWQLCHTQRANRDSASALECHNNSIISPTTTFDLVFDYTFFCSLPPSLRQEWGTQMKRILSKPDTDLPSGQLLTLMFPYVAQPRTDSPGPPFLVSHMDYLEVLTNGEEDGYSLRLSTSKPYPSHDTVSSRAGQEMVGWWSFQPR